MDCKPNILDSSFLVVLLFSDGNLTLHSEFARIDDEHYHILPWHS